MVLGGCRSFLLLVTTGKQHPLTESLLLLVHKGVYADVYDLADKLFLN